MIHEKSITELAIAELDCVSGGCDSIGSCFEQAGIWVANRIEDGVDAAVDAGKRLYAWVNS
jgi:hypothetical protein